jgi:HEAT repeat protein
MPPEPVLSVIGSKPWLMLMGDPGLGKSTTLRYVAARSGRAWLDAAENGTAPPLFPILAELRNWQSEGTCEQRLRKALPEPVAKQTTEEAWGEITELLQTGGCCLLLDGLDEYTGSPSDVFDAITVGSDTAAHRLVLSSRPIAKSVAPGWGEVPVCYLRELEPTAITALCERFCPTEPARGRLLKFATGVGAALCRIPLLLAMASRIADEPAAEMPRTRASTFDGFFAWMERWEANKPGGKPEPWPSVSAAAMRRALGPLALELRLRERTRLSKDDVQGAFSGTERSQVGAILDYLQRQNILAPAVDGIYWRFCYEVVLDYFAACGLADSEAPSDRVRGKLHWPGLAWVIPMAAGMMKSGVLSRGKCFCDWAIPKRPRQREVGVEIGVPPLKAGVREIRLPEPDAVAWRRTREYFIHRVLEQRSPYERVLRRDQAMALRCAGECDRLDARLCKRMLGGLRRMKYHVPEWFFTALCDAASCPPVEALLLKLIHDPYYDARRAAAVTGEPARLLLRDLLLDLIHHTDMRLAAVGALQGAAGEPAVQALLLELIHDPHGDMSQAAAGALQGVAVDTAVQARLLELSHDPDYGVRGATARALQGVAGEPAVQARLLELSHDGHHTVCYAVAKALQGVVGEPAVRARLLELIRGPDLGVRHATATALQGVAGEPAVQARLLELSHDPDLGVREAAAVALQGAAGEPAVQARLLELSHDPDGAVCGAAAEALRGVAGEFAVQARLLEMMRGPVLRGSWAAAEALQGVAGEPAVQARLLELSHDPKAQVRGIAAKALRGVAGEPAVQARLLELSRDPDGWVVNHATMVLREWEEATGTGDRRKPPVFLLHPCPEIPLYPIVQRLEAAAQQHNVTLRAYMTSRS